ncbi:hypothetical protein GCM10009725_31200 [Aeromicrobium tamlense]
MKNTIPEKLFEVVAPLAELVGDPVDVLEANQQRGLAKVGLLDRLAEFVLDLCPCVTLRCFRGLLQV